jgi:hypothetical protein
MRHTGGWKLGTIIFLVLALLIAVFSGDVLLVLAVGSAITGLALLVGRGGRVVESRPAAQPQQAVQSSVTLAPRLQAHGGTRRMAQRRYRSAASLSRQVTQPGRGPGAAHSSVADAPGQAQVVQVLQ